MLKQFYSNQAILALVHDLVLFDLLIRPNQGLQFRAGVVQGWMAMKRFSAFPKAPALLESHCQIVLCHYQDIHTRSLTPFQGCSWYILQPQPSGPN